MVSMQQISPRPSPVPPPVHDGVERSSDLARASECAELPPPMAGPLRVLLIDADGVSEATLRSVLARQAPCVDVQHVSRAQLRAPAAHSGPQPHQGLLFETLGPCGRAAAALPALAAVRAEPGLRELPALIALDPRHDDWLELACAFDDFLFSPWSPEELFGRIRAFELRRRPGHDEVVRIGSVAVDEGTRMASIAGSRVQLTVRELALLSYLGLRRGRVLSREHLLAEVWGESYRGGRRTVDVHIRRLRAKLGAALRIETVRSGGYKLCAEQV